jgi:NAD(P)-dependent dehydrogenase (short-subunit alcohol dehydrogenase family)
MLLKGKAGIVTGAGTGIGRACAVRFARDGAKVALLDISGDNLEETKELIQREAPGSEALCLVADVSVEESVAEAVDLAASAFGKLNYAMNNAGVMMTRAAVADVDSKDWERVLRINLFGAFYCAKYQIRQMLKSNEPCSIVFTSSVGGLIGTPSASDYVCAKHAVIGLAKSISATIRSTAYARTPSAPAR